MIYKNFSELNQNLQPNNRVIGLDVGTKTIGIAMSDSSRTISTPKLTINRKGNKKDFPALEKFIKENDIKAAIIGLPIESEGSEIDMNDFIKRFAANLDQFLSHQKICFFDESLTTFIANDDISSEWKIRNAKKKGLLDQVAAGVMLQSALDSL